MAAAYSLTPTSSQGYVASSPLTRACPIPLKRVSSSARSSGTAATGTLPPLPSLGTSNSRLSSTFADPASSLSESFRASEELFRKYSLSTSGRRRTVASSPSSDERGGVALAPPPRPEPSHVTVLGFQAAADAPDASGASLSFSAAAQAKAKPQAAKGLLSRAFSAESPLAQELALPAISTTGEVPHQDMTMFFPGVDLKPLRTLQESYPVFKSELVVTAYSVAARAHQFQSRKSGEPMLAHCVEVAKVLAGMGLDAETIAAGLLHEVLAGDLYRSQLEEFMPASVVSIIDRVATISEMSRLYRANNSTGSGTANNTFNDERFRRMLVAMEDVRAVLVKLADRVHNMRTISVLPPERQLALARETLEVYAAVANRLGVWCLKAELEDLAFGVLHPEEAAWLREAVRERQDPAALEATINCIKAALQAQGVAYEDISGRPKNLYGVWCKLRGDGKPLSAASLAGVYDLMALRVVVANKHECYTALRAVQSVYRTMPERSKDFIKDIKKPNGYQSLHETLYGEGGAPVEVQIRTHKMHYIAEYGFAAHWKYKEKLDSEDEWLEKETQYKRWLTQYKLGLHDKKVRPQGSPPTDSSLKSLGVAFLDRPDAEAQQQLDPFLRHHRFKLQLPTKSEVSVVLQTQDSIESKDLPLGTTAHQLWQDLGLGALPGYALTVNSRLPDGEAALQSGDLVQVVPLSQVLSRGAGGLGLMATSGLGRSAAGSAGGYLAGLGMMGSLVSGDADEAGGMDMIDVFGRDGRSSWAVGQGRAPAMSVSVQGA